MQEQPKARWQQRFENYQRALKQLNIALTDYDDHAPNLIKEGILQRFEFTHELAWKVLKDYLEYEGHQNITGSRSAVRMAFNLGLIEQGQIWMEMIESRNRSVHAYDEKILTEELSKVRHHYAACFVQFDKKMTELCSA